jgi:hypothetical protein
MEDRGMFKKNLFLICALSAACAPIAASEPDTFHEDEIVDVTKGKKKCCRCCSLTVTNNATIGGNLTVNGSEVVRGSVTAARFISPSGGPLLNWAVFSNQTAVTVDGAPFPWAATPATSVTAGITNNAGIITLPIGGTFFVTYTVRITATGPIDPDNSAIVLLEQGSTSGSFDVIGQPAVVALTDVIIDDGEIIQSQITAQAIVITTSAADNQFKLVSFLPDNYSIDAAISSADANATMTIQQLI